MSAEAQGPVRAVPPLIQVRPRTIVVPPLDPKFKEGAAGVNVNVFFKMWDKLVESGSDLVKQAEPGTPLTVVTVDDAIFEDLVPVDSKPNPLYDIDTFQRSVLATSVMNVRVDPNDEKMKSAEGLTVKTVDSFLMKFKYDNGKQLTQPLKTNHALKHLLLPQTF